MRHRTEYNIPTTWSSTLKAFIYFFLGSVFLEQDLPIHQSFVQIMSGLNSDENVLNGTRVDHNVQYIQDDPFDAHQKICMEMSYRLGFLSVQAV